MKLASKTVVSILMPIVGYRDEKRRLHFVLCDAYFKSSSDKNYKPARDLHGTSSIFFFSRRKWQLLNFIYFSCLSFLRMFVEVPCPLNCKEIFYPDAHLHFVLCDAYFKSSSGRNYKPARDLHGTTSIFFSRRKWQLLNLIYFFCLLFLRMFVEVPCPLNCIEIFYPDAHLATVKVEIFF